MTLDLGQGSGTTWPDVHEALLKLLQVSLIQFIDKICNTWFYQWSYSAWRKHLSNMLLICVGWEVLTTLKSYLGTQILRIWMPYIPYKSQSQSQGRIKSISCLVGMYIDHNYLFLYHVLFSLLLWSILWTFDYIQEHLIGGKYYALFVYTWCPSFEDEPPDSGTIPSPNTCIRLILLK